MLQQFGIFQALKDVFQTANGMFNEGQNDSWFERDSENIRNYREFIECLITHTADIKQGDLE